MKRIDADGKIVWTLVAWYEKTAYVLGVCFAGYIALAFIVGLIQGIAAA